MENAYNPWSTTLQSCFTKNTAEEWLAEPVVSKVAFHNNGTLIS